ncbi:hypothetical protein [Microbacterium sp. NPDC076911]|uniref:hypothetical protein n=1 Tax=Microbacterium sp. NPDC076911 TaxID=3154958 RepID=UPI00341F225C
MQTASFNSSGATITVPPGIALRPVVDGWTDLSISDLSPVGDERPARATLRLEYSESKGLFEVAAFGIDRGDLPFEVSGALLRTVRVHAIARDAIFAALPSWLREIAQLRTLGARGGLRSFAEFDLSGDDAVLLTALVYRIAEISGENPALAVAESIGLKQRTATNWVQRARTAGFMTDIDHGKAARRVAQAIKPLWNAHLSEVFTSLKAGEGTASEATHGND